MLARNPLSHDCDHFGKEVLHFRSFHVGLLGRSPFAHSSRLRTPVTRLAGSGCPITMIVTIVIKAIIIIIVMMIVMIIIKMIWQ